MGLALVQGIVRGHGGQMSVESSPGHGSCFQILFPCAPVSVEVPKRRDLRPSTNSASATVLMIEDEAVLRGAVAEVLRARGLRVLEAGDGAAALQLCRAHGRDIDVAVLDVTLPGLSSSQVLQHLREKLPTAKVVITSAYGREDAVALVNAERNHPHIRKPYRVSDLLDLIQNTMS